MPRIEISLEGNLYMDGLHCDKIYHAIITQKHN